MLSAAFMRYLLVSSSVTDLESFKLKALLRLRVADITHVLVAKAKYIFEIWALAWVLVPTMRRMVPEPFEPDSWACS